MAVEIPSTPVSPDSPLPSQAEPKPLGSLPTHAVDAVNDIKRLLHAYRCVEDLLLTPTHGSHQPEVTQHQLHALMSVLNDTLARRIRRAQRTAHRIQKRTRHSG